MPANTIFARRPAAADLPALDQMDQSMTSTVRRCRHRSSVFARSTVALAVVAGLGALGLSGAAAAQDTIPTEPPQSEAMVLRGGTIHPVSGPVIEGGVLITENGRITWVGPAADAPASPAGAVELDATGLIIAPGFVGANTIMGLMEISSVQATMDQDEVGAITPEARAIVAVNPDSTLIPVTRTAGVLTTLTMPVGGLVPGRAAVLRMEGWTWEDMAMEADAGLAINWPNLAPITAWWMRQSPEEQLKQTAENLREIELLFDAADAYSAARAADPETPEDTRYEAMLPAMRGETPVFVRANEVDQIRSAVRFISDRGLRGVIVGGADAEMCADMLQRHGVSVIVTGTHRLPGQRHAAYDRAYTLPQRLEAAGVTWCLGTVGGSFETPHERNLPFHAATAVAHGLDPDVALRSITQSAAEIIGVGDEVGSLAVGKAATFSVFDGNPLEITTQVVGIWIDGRPLPLDDKQRQLDRKYREKYRQLGIIAP
ncbi:MAG: amidohydrolase family protein [Phycisphaerales bacterium]